MSDLIELYDIYGIWYRYLLDWANLLVKPGVAERCTRSTMSEMLARAMVAHETADGPWMDSVDVMYQRLSLHPATHDSIFVASAFQQMPRPAREDMRDFARLYAALYEITYVVGWSLVERETLAILLRLYSPSYVPTEALKAAVEEQCAPNHPLRRAVRLMEVHTHDDQLICAASSQLWEWEQAKGEAWYDRETTGKGAS